VTGRHRHLATLATFAVAAFLVSGCGLSVERLEEIRAERDPAATAENQRTILDRLERSIGWAPLRAQLLSTAVELANRDEHRTNRPRLWSRLVSLLRAEYASPRVLPESATPQRDRARLRTLAVYCAGELDGPDLAGFLVEVLERDDPAPDLPHDAGARTALAAASGLASRVGVIRRSWTLHSRAAAVLPRLDALAAEADSDVREPLVRLTAYLREELEDLDTLTAALEVWLTGDERRGDLKALLELNWTWLRRELARSEPRARFLGRGRTERNIRALLDVAERAPRDLSARTRRMLVGVAPCTLFAHLTDVASKRPTAARTTLHELANLLGAFDALVAAHSEPSAGGVSRVSLHTPECGVTLDESHLIDFARGDDIRATATSAMLAYIASVRAPDREVLYARLFQRAPLLLGEHLAGRVERVLTEPLDDVMQYARYVGNLIATGALDDDRGLVARCEIALAACAMRPSREARSLVAAFILDRAPDRIVNACTAAFVGFLREEDDDAASLVDLYLASLDRAQPRSLDAIARRTLADAFVRPDARTRDKLTAFLAGRDVNLLARALAHVVELRLDALEAPKLRDLVRLGDVLVTHRRDMDAAVLDDAALTLAKSLASEERELRFHAARYLSEIDRPAADAAIEAWSATTER